jgi:hypothetical protein
VSSRDGEDLRGEQVEDEPVLVGGPHVPSRRRNDAPADSSPPKPNDPSISPGTNHLNPTGTSTISLPTSDETRSIIDEDTSVLPMRAPVGQCAR